MLPVTTIITLHLLQTRAADRLLHMLKVFIHSVEVLLEANNILVTSVIIYQTEHNNS